MNRWMWKRAWLQEYGWIQGRKTKMKEDGKKYRLEHDSIGEKEVPEDAYYGVQTLRAYENFNITGLKMHPELINSVAQIKKAAAITNFEVGELDKKERPLSPRPATRSLRESCMTSLL